MPDKRHVKRKFFRDMYFSVLVKESNVSGEEVTFQKKQKEQSENDLNEIFGSGLKNEKSERMTVFLYKRGKV